MSLNPAKKVETCSQRVDIEDSLREVKALIDSTTSEGILNDNDVQVFIEAGKKLDKLIQRSPEAMQSSLESLAKAIHSLKGRLQGAILPLRVNIDGFEKLLEMASPVEELRYATESYNFAKGTSPLVLGFFLMSFQKTTLPSLINFEKLFNEECKPLPPQQKARTTKLAGISDVIDEIDYNLETFYFLETPILLLQKILKERTFDPKTKNELETVVKRYKREFREYESSLYQDPKTLRHNYPEQATESMISSLIEIRDILVQHIDQTPPACEKGIEPKLNLKTNEEECPTKGRRSIGGITVENATEYERVIEMSLP